MQNTLELTSDILVAVPGIPIPTLASEPLAGESMEPVEVMQWLRSATDATHKSVERKTPFFQKGFDRAQYVRWLVDMVGFYRAFEAALSQTSLLTQGLWPYQSRLVLLANDLRRLGESEIADAAFSNQRVATLPPMQDHLGAAGALYVIEGSALGGQVLASRVLKSLSISLEDGGSFFQPNGPEPRIHWQQFQTLVRGMASQVQDAHAIVQGAVVMFQAFDAWLAECGWSSNPSMAS